MSARPDAVIWLNGRPLAEPCFIYDDQYKGKGTYLYEGNLNAGANTILIQVSQLGLDHGFALRALPPERMVVSGRIIDAAGKTLAEGVQAAAWQKGVELGRIRTSSSGEYRLSFLASPDEPIDISFANGTEGCWERVEKPQADCRLELNAHLHPAIDVAGTLTMLDKNQSPHREVTVQAERDGKVVAATTTDDKGHYRFINLKPGSYRIRCLTASGIFYSGARSGTMTTNRMEAGPIEVKAGQPVRNVDFRFAAFKKGFWKRFDIFDGLPNNKVQGMILSPAGELWFQTTSGLGCYNGRTFDTIQGTQGKTITALAAAADGTIWFGAYSGLYRLKNGVLDCLTVTNGLPDNLVTALCASRSGEIWIGTEYGLSVYNGKEFRTFTIDQGLVQNHITALTQAPDGSIWAGTSDGLSRYDGHAFSNFVVEDGLANNDVAAVDCTKAGQVRAATQDGVFVFDGRAFKPWLSAAEFDVSSIKTLQTLPDGRLWLGTERGISIFDGQSMVHVHPEEGLGGGNVAAIAVTAEGLIWFATYNGIARLDPDCASYTTKDGLADNRIFDVCIRQDGVWFGTEWGGAGRFNGKTFETVIPNLYTRKLLSCKDGLWVGCNKGALRYDAGQLLPGGMEPKRWIMAMDRDEQGSFWFGGGWSGGGLVKVPFDETNGVPARIWTRKDGLGDDQVYDVLCLPGGITWLATAGGLSRFDGRDFKTYTMKDGLPDNMVRAVRQGVDGAIWLGTDLGIVRFDGKSFADISAMHRLPATRIWCIYKASNGAMWFGTDTRGAYVFDGQAFSSFDTRDGLADDSIAAIGEDEHQNLWFGTFRGGLTCYRRKSVLPQVHCTQIKIGGREISGKGTESLTVRMGDPISVSFESQDWQTPAHKKQFRLCLASPDAYTGTTQRTSVIHSAEFNWSPQQSGLHILEVQAINQNLVYSPPVRLSFSAYIPWHEQPFWRIVIFLASACLVIAAVLLLAANAAQRREARQLKDRMLEQEQAARAVLEEKNRQLEASTVELKDRQAQLEEALASVKTLRGMVPICAACKKIRDDNGFWDHVESFVEKHSEAQFSHGMCPDCIKKWYPNIPVKS